MNQQQKYKKLDCEIIHGLDIQAMIDSDSLNLLQDLCILWNNDNNIITQSYYLNLFDIITK